MSGFGGGPYGSAAFGGLLQEFDVTNAVATNFEAVLVTFSNGFGSSTVDPPAGFSEIGSYSISPSLVIFGASVVYPSPIPDGFTPIQIQLITGPQVEGTVYTLTVSTALVDLNSQPLVINTAQFVGVGILLPITPTNFTASSLCDGQAIQLSYLPTEDRAHAGTMAILRRLKAWPYDLTQIDYDVVYWGQAGIASVGNTIPQTLIDLGISNINGNYSPTLSQGATSFGYEPPQAVPGPQPFTGFVTGDVLIIYEQSQTGSGAGSGSPVVNPALAEIVTVTSPNTASSSYTVHFTPAIKNAYNNPVVGRYTPLLPQTYYYYLLIYTNDGNFTRPITPTYFEFTSNSQAFGLSIASNINSYDFIWNSHPGYAKYRDGLTVDQGGGGGFLSAWTQVMGCWLNLLRGNMMAEELLNDITKTPINTLTAINESLGIQPEGLSYDYDILRRAPASLAFVYKRKGTCPGLVETVSMFTKWAAVCVDFGASRCNNGASSLTTWDETSVEGYGSGPDAYYLFGTVQSGAGYLLDETGTFNLGVTTPDIWNTGLFDGGEIRGVFGDVMCVSVNGPETGPGAIGTGLSYTIPAPPVVATITAIQTPLVQGIIIFYISEIGLIKAASSPNPGTIIQVTSTSLTDTLQDGTIVPYAEILPVLLVDPIFSSLHGGYRVTAVRVQGTTTQALAVGDTISIGKSRIRSLIEGSHGSAIGRTMHDPNGAWVTNQFTESFPGYFGAPMQLKDTIGNIFDIESNTYDTITVVTGNPDIEGSYYAISPFFTENGPTLFYRAYSGTHTFLYDPSLDLTTTGTIYDPFNPLYQGGGTTLGGIWGPSDVGIYITTPITVVSGRATTVAGNILTADPGSPLLTPGALVGLWLNPNQNQTQFFQILDNTDTTITLTGDGSSLIVPGQFYYVLKPLDYVRYQRLNTRLTTEFSDADTHIHILFF